MKKALIALLFVSAVMGMAIPTTADLNITKDLNIDMLGTNGEIISVIQPQQNNGHIQNNDDQNAIVGDITANSVAGLVINANTNIIGGIKANSVTSPVISADTNIIGYVSYSDSTSTATPTSPDPSSTPTATSSPDPSLTPYCNSNSTCELNSYPRFHYHL